MVLGDPASVRLRRNSLTVNCCFDPRSSRFAEIQPTRSPRLRLGNTTSNHAKDAIRQAARFADFPVTASLGIPCRSFILWFSSATSCFVRSEEHTSELQSLRHL